MAITTLTSQEFDEDARRARKAAESGPVFITIRGQPTYVLLGIDEYRHLVGQRGKIAVLLTTPGAEDVELDIPDFRMK